MKDELYILLEKALVAIAVTDVRDSPPQLIKGANDAYRLMVVWINELLEDRKE